MIEDAVIDTNVLMHSQDPSSHRSSDSQEFLDAFINSSAVICVDPGFTWDESSNRSQIGCEYLTHLQYGSFAYSFVQHLAQTERVVEVERAVAVRVGRRVNQMIRKKSDRTFLKVATNSVERILVSHDYTDFQVAKRKTIKTVFDVNVVEAADATKMING